MLMTLQRGSNGNLCFLRWVGQIPADARLFDGVAFSGFEGARGHLFKSPSLDSSEEWSHNTFSEASPAEFCTIHSGNGKPSQSPPSP